MCDRGECGEYVRFEDADVAISNIMQQFVADIAKAIGEVRGLCNQHQLSPEAAEDIIQRLRQLYPCRNLSNAEEDAASTDNGTGLNE